MYESELTEGWGQSAPTLRTAFLSKGTGQFATAFCVETEHGQKVLAMPFCTTARERWQYQESVAKLARTAELVAAGVSVQITKLFPIQCLLSDRLRYLDFACYLLGRLKDELKRGQSISSVHLLPMEQKADVVLQALWMLQRLSLEEHAPTTEMLALLEYIGSLHPGRRKRIWVHASRRSLPDADLLLVEKALRCCGKQGSGPLHGYWMAQMFVTNYYKLRYYVPPESARRWWMIVDYWRSRQTYWMYGWEWYHFRPLEKQAHWLPVRCIAPIPPQPASNPLE
jgi:hypothetical protein